MQVLVRGSHMRTSLSLLLLALLGLASACAHSPSQLTDIPVRAATHSYLKNLAMAEGRASEVVRLTDYKLIAAESTPALIGQRSGALQGLGTMRSFVGDLDGSLRAMSAVFTPSGRSALKPLSERQLELVEKSLAEDAIAAIVREAKSRQIVTLNEAHNMPMHRAFAMRLARELRKLGFTHLACEGFIVMQPNGNLPAPGPVDAGYPTATSGYYVQEPHFGEFIRDAARDGWKFVSYEHSRIEPGLSPRERVTSREGGQAQNLIDKIFSHQPDAKVFVYAGYAHAAKGALPFSDSKSMEWMAARLKTKTGIDPLTIDQTTQYAVPDRLGETQLYRALLAKHNLKTPFVVRDAQGKSILVNQPSEAFDFQIVYPDYGTDNGIPVWRKIIAGRVEHAVPSSLLPASGRRLVYAFASDEPSAAIPVDLALLEAGKPAPKLMLPPGKYRIGYENE